MNQNLIQTLIGAVVSALFAGNVFFVKRLVDKLDSTEQTVWSLRQEIAVLSARVDSLSRRRNGERVPEGTRN